MVERRVVLAAGLGLAVAAVPLLGGCRARSPQARPPARRPHVGLLQPGAGSPEQTPILVAFRRGLQELGYVEGESIVVTYRHSGGQNDRLPALAAELVQLNVDVIVAGGVLATQAAKDATATIPIVMTNSLDPVGMGLIASLARPGGNVTGLTNLGSELSGKRLALLKEALPGLSRLAVLWDPAAPPGVPEFRETTRAAAALGVHLIPLAVRGPDDYAAAFAEATSEQADALITLRGPAIVPHRRPIVTLAAEHLLPAMYTEVEFVQVGGLMAYTANLPDQYRRAAGYVDKILKGARPADLPVERPTTVDFIINLQTARALGLIIPPSVLAQATEVIQ